MILTADSAVAHATARRLTPDGWITTFIGQNRGTVRPGDAMPESGCLYPMAFLVEKGAGAVVPSHFHQADQYQVVVLGSGRVGVHDVAGMAVHYTDAYSAYGPIVAADEGIAWFTLRNCWRCAGRYRAPGSQALRRVNQAMPSSAATIGP